MAALDSVLQILSGSLGTGAVVGYWLYRTLQRNDALEKQLTETREVAQKQLNELHAYRLADEKATSKLLIDEIHAQRDALDAGASASRDQAEALDALSKNLAEHRTDIRELIKEIGALRVRRGGGG